MDEKRIERLTAFKTDFEAELKYGEFSFADHQGVKLGEVNTSKGHIRMTFRTIYSSDMKKIIELTDKHKLLFFIDVGYTIIH